MAENTHKSHRHDASTTTQRHCETWNGTSFVSFYSSVYNFWSLIQDGSDDIKAVVHELSEMRYHMTTDKQLLLLTDKCDDVNVYNDSINQLKCQVS